jgi:hypothetical protein
VRCLYNKCQGVMVVCSCAQKPIPVSSRVAPTLGPDESFSQPGLAKHGASGLGRYTCASGSTISVMLALGSDPCTDRGPELLPVARGARLRQRD